MRTIPISPIFPAIAALFLALFFSKNLTAQTADMTKGCAPMAVKFTPPAGQTGFFWDFKDGGSSNLQSPSNIFSTPGTYKVEFKNTPGGTVVGTVEITVFPKPEIMVTATPTKGCRPLNVQFANTTQLAGDISISNFFWVFGDGGSTSGPAAPSHLYNITGKMDVSLEITTNYATCNITQVFPGLVETGNKPVISFTTNPSPAAACLPPLAVTFDNKTTGGTGNLTYAWTFGNGQNSTAMNPPQQIYAALGNFTATLTATDALGCSASASSLVSVGSPNAGFEVPDTVCFDAPVIFQNTSAAGNYSWSFGAGAVPPTSIQFNPRIHFKTVGNQLVTLIVNAPGGCSDTISKTIFVDRPDANFSVAPIYSCADPTVFNLNALSAAANSWTWLFENGTTKNTKTITYNWQNPDKTGFTLNGQALDSIFLVVSNPSGCRDTVLKVQEIWLPNARFMPNKYHGCAPLTVIFSDSSTSKEPISQWIWSFDDGSPNVTATNGNDQTHTFTAPGEYDVRLSIKNSAGCTDTSYWIKIEVGGPISATFTTDKTEVCPGDSVHFSHTTPDPNGLIDGWHFSSESDQQWHCFQDKNPVWAYTTETGDLDVEVTIDYNGCYTTTKFQDFIRVKGPISKIKYEMLSCDSSQWFDFTDMSSGADSIKWYFGDGDSSILKNVRHQYLKTGTYQFILVAQNPATGCPISRDTATVFATNLESKFEIEYKQCGGTPFKFDASASPDVNAVCGKGYVWYFDWNRPIQTDMAVLDFALPLTGPHQVWLVTEDINGCRDTTTHKFKSFNVASNFTASDNSICLPTTVNFTDQSFADTTIVKWEWDFGDGTTSTDKNPSHTFTNPPLDGGQFFNVTLKITDVLDCPNAQTAQIQLYTPFSGIATFPTPAQICVGGKVFFSASDFTAGGSNLSWTWNFGDGSTATGKTTDHQFNQAGLINTVLTFTEIASGCVGTNQVLVDVQAFPEAMFTTNVDAQSIICHPQNMAFTSTTASTSPVSVVWNLGNGVLSTGNSTATVYPKGTFSATMIAATSAGCADTVTRKFTVVGPEGTFSMDKTKICKGGNIVFTMKDTADISSWQWSFGDGTVQNGTNPVTHTYNFLPPTGQTLAKLVLKSEDDACAFTVELPINFSLVNADFEVASPTVCFGAPIEFQNTSSDFDQSAWDFGDGQTSTVADPEYIFKKEGDFLVTLIVKDLPLGCLDTVSKVVEVTGLPNFSAFGDTICPGDTALIGVNLAGTFNTFTWSPANQIIGPKNTQNVFVKPAISSNYVVSVVDAMGCRGIDTAFVFVGNAFTGATNLDTFVEKGAKVVLPVSDDPNFVFEWKPTDLGQNGPWMLTASDTSLHYSLIVRDLLGCVEKMFEFHIRIVVDSLVAPTAFTPGNGDDVNDVFRLLAVGDEKGQIELQYFRIYNRWGEKVFEGSGKENSPQTAWDGIVEDKPAPSDVYVWVASVKFRTGKERVFKGEITLLR